VAALGLAIGIALSVISAGCGTAADGLAQAAPEDAGATTSPNDDDGGARPGRRRPVPILMYHAVAEPPAGAPYPALYVPPADFAAEMRWLARHGYRAVTLDQVYASWRHGAALPPHPIVVTFDDGYRSIFTSAFPVLRRRGWAAVLNLEVENESKPWGLSPRRVRALVAAGWELASHTLTHPDLTTLSPDALRREVAGSRERLRRQFGTPVNFFCYPAGRYDERVVTAVRRAGYHGATTVRSGLGRPSEPYVLARIRVDGTTGMDGFRRTMRKIAGA